MSLIGPYAATLGITVAIEGDGPVLTLPFADGVLGRPGFLHGGAIAGLLETAAYAALIHRLGGAARIEPLTLTIDFMRAGLRQATFASAVVTRLGRRVANVEAHAWQEDRARPIGAARMNLMIEGAGPGEPPGPDRQ